MLQHDVLQSIMKNNESFQLTHDEVQLALRIDDLVKPDDIGMLMFGQSGQQFDFQIVLLQGFCCQLRLVHDFNSHQFGYSRNETSVSADMCTKFAHIKTGQDTDRTSSAGLV